MVEVGLKDIIRSKEGCCRSIPLNQTTSGRRGTVRSGQLSGRGGRQVGVGNEFIARDYLIRSRDHIKINQDNRKVRVISNHDLDSGKVKVVG